MVSIPAKLDPDSIKLTFGKWTGFTPNHVFDVREDYSYIVWLYENVEPKVLSKELYEEAQEQIEIRHDLEGDRWSIY